MTDIGGSGRRAPQGDDARRRSVPAVAPGGSGTEAGSAEAAERVRTERAPAKINLALHVLGRRADGYHDLESLVVFAPAAGDRLRFEDADRDGVETSGPFASALADGADNLVCRARDALRRAASDHPCPPVLIKLEKNLPVASGLGGGSSDAAAALRGLARLWGVGDGRPEERIAPSLGADVPMCLLARPLVARGVGERLDPVAGLPRLALALVNPGASLSTPAVFAALAMRENPPLPALPRRFGFDGLAAWLTQTRNDLQAPAQTLAPEIRDALSALEAEGAALARMSGSGATCFGLFPSRDAAARAALAIKARQPRWWVVATETGASDAD